MRIACRSCRCGRTRLRPTTTMIDIRDYCRLGLCVASDDYCCLRRKTECWPVSKSANGRDGNLNRVVPETWSGGQKKQHRSNPIHRRRVAQPRLSGHAGSSFSAKKPGGFHGPRSQMKDRDSTDRKTGNVCCGVSVT